VWGGYLFGTKREPTTGFIGPSSNFVPVDARANERIFFRMKYDQHPNNTNSTDTGKIQFTTVAEPLFDDDKSTTFEVFPDGKWHFYELNMGEVQAWVGEINNVRFWPCINGARNDEFFLNFFEIGSNNFTFSFENERAGTSGKAISGGILTGDITITKDVNDKLIVDIDGYGDVQITLTPQAAPPLIIARDISLQLGKVGIGGYIRAEAFIDSATQKLTIESGIRAADSSVEIKDGPQSAGVTLGFLAINGAFIGSTTTGSDPAVDFEPLSTYRLTTLEILALFDNDPVLPSFTIDPTAYVVEGGRRDYATTNRKLTTEILLVGTDGGRQGEAITTAEAFDGDGRTFIDINHPFSDDGELEKIFLNGIADTGGASKWKIFRPSLDGTLTLIYEGSIGETPPLGTNEVLSAEPGVYVTDVSTQDINVRRGDMLGVYNADMHTGAYGATKADAQYYDISGDAQGTFTPSPPAGAGEAGLPIYARGRITKNKAVVDIDLGRRLNLDTVQVEGFEDTRDLEYNVAIVTSASFSVDTGDTHTICYSPTPTTRDCFARTNKAFNTDALNDGIISAENGIAGFGDPGRFGLGGADADGATYFYINGDGEWLDVEEFVGQGPALYDFQRDPYAIDCFFSASTPRLDKPIGKAVIHFKDKKNQRSWQIEYALPGAGKGGNGSKPGFQIIPSESLRAVEFDSKRFEQLEGFVTTKVDSQTSALLLQNPVILDVIAADGTRNPQQGVDYTFNAGELGGVNTREQATFLDFQWNKFQWEFDAIRTTGFRYWSDYHWSTKISEFQVFAVSESFESLGDNTQVLFSADGESFITAELLTSDETTANYKLGGSPQYMRLIFRPTLLLSINEVQVEFEEDQVSFGEEGCIVGAVDIPDSRVGETGEAYPLVITNQTGESADLILDVPVDIQSSKQLLYFSKLSGADDITTPQVGPPGRVDFTEDKVLKEEENIAINAHCYGLENLVAGSSDVYITDNYLTNPGFETGDLTGWNLNVIQSGTKSFQIPRVLNADEPPDEDTSAGIFQEGDYVFGFSIDKGIPEQEEDYTPIEFELFTETVDVSEYADQIDTGQAYAEFSLRYLTFYTGDEPIVRFLGAPTVSGVEAPVGTLVNLSYGSNVLRSDTLPKSEVIGDESSASSNMSITLKARIKANTRFLRMQVYVDAPSEEQDVFATNIRQKFLSDDYELTLEIPSVTSARWYKSWRTGLVPTVSGAEFDGWTDTSFIPVTEFVAITGSEHWWQPWDSLNTGGVPDGGPKTQTQGYSNAFLGDRVKGIQSFRRMITGDPGVLGAQWSGEKEIAGLRIAMHHMIFSTVQFATTWPRFFMVEVLKTRDELGGVAPDINNPSHFKVVTTYRNVDAENNPTTELFGSTVLMDGPWSIVTTWLFEEKPILTEGMRITFMRNCDKFERDLYPDSDAFAAATGCPPDNIGIGYDFVSSYGIGVSYFTPLESIGNTNLPIDNVQETHIVDADNPLGNVYVAVDLGRHHAIEIDADLFELIADTPSQSEFNVGSVVYSADDTSDPNEVVWAGSSNNARWIRFRTNASLKFEDPADLKESTDISNPDFYVEAIPQATLNQARIYPDITVSKFFLEGYNASWADLGTNLSDNKASTSIYYSDYPVIALDLGKEYIISDDTDIIRKRHDTVGTEPESGPGSTDLSYWDPDTEDNWTYAFSASPSPERVPFLEYGSGVPDRAVRWVAVKGAAPLTVSEPLDPPKRYNFQTSGQALFYITVRPRTPQVFTENAQFFSNTKAVLSDISTFQFTLGQLVTVFDGQDYGSAAGWTGNSSDSTADNLGDPYRAFDGLFDELGADFDGWGIQVRDLVTGRENSADDFPHSIWRVFRNVTTDVYETKAVKAITVRGYDENFYPKDFKFQKLEEESDGSIKDPNLDSSWEDIEDASFSDIDTFQDGHGFTYYFPAAVETKGIRVRITDSEYPDDSVLAQWDEDNESYNATDPQASGPQTRVAYIIIYEEVVEVSSITGTIETNQMLSAAVSSNTSTPDHDANKLKDNDIDTYWQSTGFSDTVTISLPAPKDITRLEWEQDPNLGAQSAGASTNAPHNFTLKGVVGGEEQILVVGSGYIGATFSGTLEGAPVTAQNFTFEVTQPQGVYEDANSIIVSELRLIEVVERTTPLATVESSFVKRPGSTNLSTTKVTYAANSDAVAKITADGIDGNNDPYFSERDFFSLWLHINDVSLLDTAYGNIKLGNDSETFYRWDLQNLNLQTGWNELKLQFRTANDRSAIPFQPGYNYNSNEGDSEVDFLTEDVTFTSFVDGTFSRRIVNAPGIRFFEIEFRGNRGAQDLELILDDFRFTRNRFEDTCHFAPALYLNNSELFNIFLQGVDIATGTVEFWFQPDWGRGGRLAADRPIIPALFRIVRPDGKFLSLFYRPNQGFIPMVYDGKRLLQFITEVTKYPFERFDTFHVALVWDAEGRVGDQGATLALYINGEPVFGTDQTWDAIREGGATVMFGGEVGQRFASTPDNSTALLYTAVPTMPAQNTASAWGLLENLKIYNYPRTNFDDRNSRNLERTQLLTPSEMIEISTDGVNFSGVGSSELPLVVRNVSAGDSVTAYIRTIIPKGLTGEEQRDASLLVRWKTPLRDCD
jgi:hypothetical protein